MSSTGRGWDYGCTRMQHKHIQLHVLTQLLTNLWFKDHAGLQIASDPALP